MINLKSSCTVLIVDDDEFITRLLREALEGEGWQTSRAMDGAEALRLFNEISPDIVILDLILPKIDGVDVCRSIRQQSQVPILILSAKSDEEDKLACLGIGANDYVTKPFDIEELLARVKALLRRTRPSGSEIIQTNLVCDALEIDFNARRVTVQGNEISLTPIEYGLLKELVLNMGNVLKYEALLTKIWGHDYIETVHHLHTHIYSLRKKIETDTQHYRIVNVNRVGFRFDIKPW